MNTPATHKDMLQVGPPYLGAAYYPEDWPLEQVDEDIRLMKEAGLNSVRIAEFAWSTMEPEEGQCNFEWLRTVVDKLADAGIAVVMGTPTATPPAWLTSKHPEILFEREDGSKVEHGGRRHYDPCSEVYLEHCKRIADKMADEFGQDDRIIGWQIDNELYPHNYNMWDQFPLCCTDTCLKAFHGFLKDRFGSIDKLNDAWCTSLWSQTYNSFEQIPKPDARTWHHPSFKTAWREFMEQAYIDFARIQCDVLRAKVKQPIGTNMMLLYGVDWYRIYEFLDVVQFDQYSYHGDFQQGAFWFDICRPIKQDQPFWNIELSTCWSGHVATSGYSEKGFCVANTWLPIALGGEMASYWLWRQHWAGQELTHGCVIASTGRPMHIFGEVQELSRGFQRCADFLNGTKAVNSGLAIHYSTLAFHTLGEQWLTQDFDYRGYLQNRVYHPLRRAQFRPDLINVRHSLDAYKVVYSPFIPALDEGGLRERLQEWIENGGTWIAGPFTDMRDLHGAKFTDKPFKSLEDWAGVFTKYQIPGNPREFNITLEDGTKTQGTLQFDGFELQGGEALATYDEYPFEGQAAIARKQMGKGQIIVCGTLPKPQDLPRLLRRWAEPQGVAPVAEAGENLLVVPRDGQAGRGMILVELENKPAAVSLPEKAVDLLTGEEFSGAVHVVPYGVRVLKFRA